MHPPISMSEFVSRHLCPQRLPLSGAVNFRDLGGYRTEDGRQVKRGLVFRSDHLSRLTAEDQQILRRLRFKVVCDLRTALEQQRHPDLLPQMVRFACSSSRCKRETSIRPWPWIACGPENATGCHLIFSSVCTGSILMISVRYGAKFCGSLPIQRTCPWSFTAPAARIAPESVQPCC